MSRKPEVSLPFHYGSFSWQVTLLPDYFFHVAYFAFDFPSNFLFPASFLEVWILGHLACNFFRLAFDFMRTSVNFISNAAFHNKLENFPAVYFAAR
jgi:hypothetical protein